MSSLWHRLGRAAQLSAKRGGSPLLYAASSANLPNPGLSRHGLSDSSSAKRIIPLLSRAAWASGDGHRCQNKFYLRGNRCTETFKKTNTSGSTPCHDCGLSTKRSVATVDAIAKRFLVRATARSTSNEDATAFL